LEESILLAFIFYKYKCQGQVPGQGEVFYNKSSQSQPVQSRLISSKAFPFEIFQSIRSTMIISNNQIQNFSVSIFFFPQSQHQKSKSNQVLLSLSHTAIYWDHLCDGHWRCKDEEDRPFPKEMMIKCLSLDIFIATIDVLDSHFPVVTRD
jgi:hypothetical protein